MQATRSGTGWTAASTPNALRRAGARCVPPWTKQAYRIVPVHPDDRHLLCGGQIIADKVLPFGLRSAPIIFTALADALQWIMARKGVHPVAHYLDDFITLGPPHSLQCSRNLEGIIRTCNYTGTPLEESKCEGPSPVLTFLGMELDSIRMEIRLPTDKLQRIYYLNGRDAGRARRESCYPSLGTCNTPPRRYVRAACSYGG